MILVSGSFMHVHLTLHCQIHESEHVCEYATFSMLALHVVHLLLLDLYMLLTLKALETFILILFSEQ